MPDEQAPPTDLIPSSMRDEIMAWNDGKGIALGTWADYNGNFKLAVGYAAFFWPEFEMIKGYILHKGCPTDSIRSWEKALKGDRRAVQVVLNHWHLDNLHDHDQENLTHDKLVYIGTKLKEMYSAKLAWQFPEHPCVVEFWHPENTEDYFEYELTFWQTEWDESGKE
jgi:hypothetical protein